MQGHTKWVTSVAWEPAHRALPARRFVSGSQDRTLRVWDAVRPVQHRQPHTALLKQLQSAAPAGPGERGCGGHKHTCCHFATQVTLQCLFSMSSHTLAVSCVRWGGDGLLYSASKDTTINVWDSQVRSGGTAAEALQLEAANDRTYALCRCSRSTCTPPVTLDWSDADSVTDMQQGKLIRSLKGHGHWVNTLALSTEHALRTGAFDHTGSAPQDPDTARQVHDLVPHLPQLAAYIAVNALHTSGAASITIVGTGTKQLIIIWRC